MKNLSAQTHNKIDNRIYFHIYNQGPENRPIFKDEEDCEKFLSFLKDYLGAPKDTNSLKQTFQVNGRSFQGIPHQPKNYFNKLELIAYSLITDHFHLILHQQTNESPEKFIRSLCTRYAIYFNKKYHRTGSLFQGPYKSAKIKDGLQLAYLTRYLHQGGGYSSYPEYLNSRESGWVKSDVVLNFLNQEGIGYEDFMGQYKYEEKEITKGVTLDSQTGHLERSTQANQKEQINHPERSASTSSQPVRIRITEFVTVSSAMFVLLLTLGLRHIWISEAHSHYIQPSPTPNVLSEVIEVSTAPADAVKPETLPETLIEATPEAKPKTTIKVKADDGSSTVNIRQKPNINSEKVAKAIEGDIFEFISKSSEWFEIKLASGSAYISTKYAEEEN